uniref:Chico n=1 Tax=Seriola lalandi dorsalis TaxID=1841481 RepID=A0A3B4WFK3_SERLL
MMFPQSRHSSSQPLKFTTSDSCDRIKDEFQFLQAQYHSLKLECDKLASEKSEMQRHYIMPSFCGYLAEIVKRLNGICAQVLPYLSQEQQLQVQHLSQLQGLALPVTPLPLGLTPPTLPAVSSSSGLLSLSSILANYSHGQAQVVKEDKAREAAERAPRGEDGDKSD